MEVDLNNSDEAELDLKTTIAYTPCSCCCWFGFLFTET